MGWAGLEGPSNGLGEKRGEQNQKEPLGLNCWPEIYSSSELPKDLDMEEGRDQVHTQLSGSSHDLFKQGHIRGLRLSQGDVALSSCIFLRSLFSGILTRASREPQCF